MTKLNNVLRKLDNQKEILTLLCKKISLLEEENYFLLKQNLELRSIQTELIRELGNRIYKSK